MKQFLQSKIIISTVALGLIASLGLATVSGDVSLAESAASQARDGLQAAGGNSNTQNLPGLIEIVVNVLLFIIGAVSVIMIIIGGFKYVISNGDSSQITSAKNTILYAVIGLVIALLAFAIVRFVINQFAK